MLIHFTIFFLDYCLAVSNNAGATGVSLGQTERRAAVALEFWTLLCEEWGSGASRDVLAAYLSGKPLLQLLLQTLCGTALDDTKRADQQGTSRIQDAAIAFFRQFCWAHRDNSRLFAEILLSVLQPVGKLNIYTQIFFQVLISNVLFFYKGTSSKLLTGFTRRLLLQLLLEPEKIYVHVTSASGQCGLPVSAAALSSATIVEPRHPAYKHGKKHKLVYLNAETSCHELVRLLTGTLSVSSLFHAFKFLNLFWT